MKLVTHLVHAVKALGDILIHTSVKLVTQSRPDRVRRYSILIHTSVKLVTQMNTVYSLLISNFNPHEREARDIDPTTNEVNRLILIHTSVKLVTDPNQRQRHCNCDFNPHEREARDRSRAETRPFVGLF